MLDPHQEPQISQRITNLKTFIDDLPEKVKGVKDLFKNEFRNLREISVEDDWNQLFRLLVDTFTTLKFGVQMLGIVYKTLPATPSGSGYPPSSPNPTTTPFLRFEPRSGGDVESRLTPVREEIRVLKTFFTSLSKSIDQLATSSSLSRKDNVENKKTFHKTLELLRDFRQQNQKDLTILKKQIKFLYQKCLFLFLYLNLNKDNKDKVTPTLQILDDLTNYGQELTMSKEKIYQHLDGQQYDPKYDQPTDTLYDLVLSQKIFTAREISKLIVEYTQCVQHIEQKPEDTECMEHINDAKDIGLEDNDIIKDINGEDTTNKALHYIFSAVTIFLLLI